MDAVNQIGTLIAIGQEAATALDWHKILAGDAHESYRVAPKKLPRNQID